ncbi:uncharacterized protein LOC120331959 [Styela clava]
MYHALTILASLLISSSLSFEQKCFYPDSVQELNIQKLTGTTWYSLLRTIDVASSNTMCERVSNFTETDDGFKVKLRTYTGGLKHVDWISHFNLDRSGVYYEDKKQDDTAMTAAYASGNKDELNKATKNIVENVLMKDGFVFVTDYLNYFTTILCRESGEWMIWTLFPNTTPSLENVVAAYSAMHNMGIFAQLYTIECQAGH